VLIPRQFPISEVTTSGVPISGNSGAITCQQGLAEVNSGQVPSLGSQWWFPLGHVQLPVKIVMPVVLGAPSGFPVHVVQPVSVWNEMTLHQIQQIYTGATTSEYSI